MRKTLLSSYSRVLRYHPACLSRTGDIPYVLSVLTQKEPNPDSYRERLHKLFRKSLASLSQRFDHFSVKNRKSEALTHSQSENFLATNFVSLFPQKFSARRLEIPKISIEKLYDAGY